MSSASEIFNNQIQLALAGIEGVRNLSDDIIVFGKTQEEHDMALHQAICRLKEKGLTLNVKKCQFNKSKTTFYGLDFSKDGVTPDESKIQDLKNAKRPQDVKEVCSLLGMTNYSARFIQNFADIVKPLRDLTKKDSPWQWGDKEEKSLIRLKDSLTKARTMVYFSPEKETVVYVDASPVGVAAILTQHSPGEEHGQVVAYASRALRDPETRYSQTEREAVAIVYGCEKFHMYVYGKPFSVVTDHKPLEALWNNPKSKQTARLERLSLRLQAYDVKIIYKPGDSNPADYMSRYVELKPDGQKSAVEEYINFIADYAVPKAMSQEEIVEATRTDTVLQEVAQLIQSGKWFQATGDAKLFRGVKEELTLTENSLILRGCRMVIPEKFKTELLIWHMKAIKE